MMERSLKPVSANPELLERIKRSKAMLKEGKALPSIANEMLVDLDSLSLILNKSPESAYELMRASRELATAIGNRKALVLLVDFPDKAATQTKKHYQDMLFSSGVYSGGSLTDFYKEASYNQLTITGDVFGQGVTVGWYRAPSSSSYYAGDNFGIYGKYPNNAQKLVEDVVALAASQVNYANYDNDRDGVVDALFVVHAGTGAEVTGKKSDIWSHQWGINAKTYNGVKVSTYSMEPEDGKIGVFCHELGHVFGLPDLYDYGYDSAGTGAWDLMAAGSWGNGGNTPAHQIGWCKTKLGWINPTVIFNSQQTVTIKPFATNAQLIKVPIGSLTSKEYFLLENRKRVGFDYSLPGEGLLITHVDENKVNNDDQTHYLVAIEQCDGKLDLEKNANAGDSNDPYPCAGNVAFSFSTNPNSKAYGGADSKITISNIQRSGENIIATINMGGVVTPTWYNSKKVIQTYAACSTQWAWAYISDVPGGWKQINAGSPDGVTNLFALCCYAQAKGKSVNVYADDKYIYQMYII
jgi:immune inhibitor A